MAVTCIDDYPFQMKVFIVKKSFKLIRPVNNPVNLTKLYIQNKPQHYLKKDSVVV